MRGFEVTYSKPIEIRKNEFQSEVVLKGKVVGSLIFNSLDKEFKFLRGERDGI